VAGAFLLAASVGGLIFTWRPDRRLPVVQNPSPLFGFVFAALGRLYRKPSSKQRRVSLERTQLFLVSSIKGAGFASGDDPMRQVALYTRVSTDRQTTENQEMELRAIAARAGWNVVRVYQDDGISGAKGREERPAFDALCKDAARRQFDMVMAWSVDRLGRSLQDLISFLSELHALGIDLMLHQQGLDTTTPAGKAYVSDDGRVCRVRARHDPGAGEGWP
jgi:hypothetical protein